jgi:DNA-binding transcriptional LysR family regulator
MGLIICETRQVRLLCQLSYEARLLLLEQAEHVRARVAATATITIGSPADSAEQAGTRLAAAFRRRHPAVQVGNREADFSDPTAGLRAGLADVAITLAPFDDTGISTHVLRTYPMGVVLRADDDPLADRGSLRRHDLADRRWFQLPDGTESHLARLLERHDAWRRAPGWSSGMHRLRPERVLRVKVGRRQVKAATRGDRGCPRPIRHARYRAGMDAGRRVSLKCQA